jgi:two-component system response regulator NreC
MAISVLVADDTSIIRHAIRGMLDSKRDLQVVGEAADFAETMRLIETIRPDIVIMDLHMPGEFKGKPAEVKSQLRKSSSLLLAISIWSDHDAQALADSFGASKLLSKMDLAETLTPTIVALVESKRRRMADRVALLRRRSSNVKRSSRLAHFHRGP